MQTCVWKSNLHTWNIHHNAFTSIKWLWRHSFVFFFMLFLSKDLYFCSVFEGEKWEIEKWNLNRYSLICCTAICCCWCCWCAAAAAVAAACAAACALSTWAVSSPPTSPPSSTSTPPSAPLEYNPIIVTTAPNSTRLTTKLFTLNLRKYRWPNHESDSVQRRFHFCGWRQKKKQNTICLHSSEFPANVITN